ncbi:MAG: pyruvate phosphate dikinase [Modestobacter sp.]|nr:pyruvate phosphate dikinase [Modestobacter sp.]
MTATAVSGPRSVVLDGSVELGKALLGSKAWGIVRMRRAGLPVPPAFALPVPECARYHQAGRCLDDGAWAAVREGMAELERATGKRFGDPSAPLLVSVRSGAAVSMPGMMDTVLDLGITDEVEQALAAATGDADFARDTHARFCAQFGRIVLGADIDPPDPDASAAEVRSAVEEDCGEAVPGDPWVQLRRAICAVFESWGSRRAVAYRKHWGISDLGGTAVTVQAMVFGNLGKGSGTGVLFTRDPLTGAPEPYGEWLPGGQGEDVVSGTHAVQSLADLARDLPEVHEQLVDVGRRLEAEHGDLQDVEFTVEQGRLYLLQTRAAKRSPAAAVRTAVELVEEGVITPSTALSRVTPEQVASVLRPVLAPGATDDAEILATGEPACPGVAGGVAVTDPDEADAMAAEGRDAVLVRPTTSPEDVAGMIAARAVVTELGGATSHAAVVTRALGRPSVVGVGQGTVAAWLGREVTVDASAGRVYAGRLPTEEVAVDADPHLVQLLAWVREAAPVSVRTGDAGSDVVDLDAAGIGLDPERPPADDELDATLAGATVARGAVLNTAAGAAAALRAGVTTVVALPSQPELVLLMRFFTTACSDD